MTSVDDIRLGRAWRRRRGYATDGFRNIPSVLCAVPPWRSTFYYCFGISLDVSVGPARWGHRTWSGNFPALRVTRDRVIKIENDGRDNGPPGTKDLVFFCLPRRAYKRREQSAADHAHVSSSNFATIARSSRPGNGLRRRSAARTCDVAHPARFASNKSNIRVSFSGDLWCEREERWSALLEKIVLHGAANRQSRYSCAPWPAP